MALYYDQAVQLALAAASTALMLVSIRAYQRRPELRYLLLMVAFVFLSVATIGNAVLAFGVGLGQTAVALEVYLLPSLELLTVVSLLCAMVWSSRSGRRFASLFVVVVLSIGGLSLASYVSESGTTQSILPSGCARQAGGFLIVASSLGFNDSAAHGAPAKTWPVISVTKGTQVEITVCNIYSQAVGFQVTHYLSDKTQTIAPGGVFSVSFLADEAGTFSVYCATFSPIHVYLQGGELNVL